MLDTLFTKHPTTPRFFAPSFFSPDAGKVRFAVQARCIKRWGGGGGCVEKKERDTVSFATTFIFRAENDRLSRWATDSKEVGTLLPLLS